MKTSLARVHVILIILLALAAAPYFIGLGTSSLWDSNEAFYAQTPREMIESGDYINPSFNYQPRFNKPPLSYWVVAVFYKLFGVSEQVERIPIAIAAVVIMATVFMLGRLLYSLEAGLLAAIALAATPRFLMFSRRIIIDVYLAMFMGLVLLFFVLAQSSPRRRRLYLVLMYASAGLAVLTKGPVAVLLPGLAFFLYLALNRKLSFLREMMLPAGAAIVCAIVLPWYAAVYSEHGWHYIQSFLLRDNLSRFTEPVWGPRRGFFFYVPVMIGDMFPWSLVLLLALFGGLWKVSGLSKKMSETVNPINQPEGEGARFPMLLPIWIIVIVAFFSLSRSKEDLYILPVYAAAAAIIGNVLWRATHQTRRLIPRSLFNFTIAAIGIVVTIAGAAVVYLFTGSEQAYALKGAMAIGSVAIIGGIVVALSSVLRKEMLAIVGLGLTLIIINWVFVLRTLPDFERYKPVRSLCEIIASESSESAMAGYYRIASPSMVFYLQRKIFEYYQADELRTALGSGSEVYCLILGQDYDQIKESLPVATYILASRPVFQVKLKSILDRAEFPQVLLISNKDGARSSQ